RLHLDAAGGAGRTSRAILEHLRNHGVQVKRFHRWSWRLPLRYNRRNHRKLLVVDGQIAYVGGFNIHRESARSIVGEQRWRDTHIAVEGALAAEAAHLFEAFWRGRPGAGRRGRIELPALLSNHSRACRRRLHRLYADALASARERICVTTPYFVPDPRILRRLVRAARRGLRVDLLVPAHSDVPLAQWATRAYYGHLIKAGVRVHEYGPRMLHAKTLVIDGRWAAVGTANLDYRSLHLNYELVVATDDAGLCARLQRQFDEDAAESVRIAVQTFGRRSWWQRLAERIVYALRRWL
ncbi:MAG: phospholipase D-like domain-containing protein, partial [Gammaproteobacteria bacterium]